MRFIQKRINTGLLAAGILLAAGVAQGSAFISNGSIALGVNSHGHLNVDASGAPFGLTPGSGPYPGASLSGTSPVGLRSVFLGGGGNASTEPGCLCEGWGAAVGGAGAFAGVTGHANRDFGAPVNLSLVSFTATASTATSVVNINGVGGVPVLQVTHFYHPTAATPFLYQVDVSITNTSGAALADGDLRYRRVMDWDVEPTAFSEFVTIQGVPALRGVANGNNVRQTGNDGFETANPLSASSVVFGVGGARPCTAASMLNSNFTDCGAGDHGALFDFEFEALAAGATRTFAIFYGAAPTEAAADAARLAVGAGLYSYGQCNPTNPSCSFVATGGGPNTFIFGFGSEGGVLLPPPVGGAVPEPSALALAGLGLALLAGMRRRKHS